MGMTGPVTKPRSSSIIWSTAHAIKRDYIEVDTIAPEQGAKWWHTNHTGRDRCTYTDQRIKSVTHATVAEVSNLSYLPQLHVGATATQESTCKRTGWGCSFELCVKRRKSKNGVRTILSPCAGFAGLGQGLFLRFPPRPTRRAAPISPNNSSVSTDVSWCQCMHTLVRSIWRRKEWPRPLFAWAPSTKPVAVTCMALKDAKATASEHDR